VGRAQKSQQKGEKVESLQTSTVMFTAVQFTPGLSPRQGLVVV